MLEQEPVLQNSCGPVGYKKVVWVDDRTLRRPRQLSYSSSGSPLPSGAISLTLYRAEMCPKITPAPPGFPCTNHRSDPSGRSGSSDLTNAMRPVSKKVMYRALLTWAKELFSRSLSTRRGQEAGRPMLLTRGLPRPALSVSCCAESSKKTDYRLFNQAVDIPSLVRHILGRFLSSGVVLIRAGDSVRDRGVGPK